MDVWLHISLWKRQIILRILGETVIAVAVLELPPRPRAAHASGLIFIQQDILYFVARSIDRNWQI